MSGPLAPNNERLGDWGTTESIVNSDTEPRPEGAHAPDFQSNRDRQGAAVVTL